MPRDSRWLPKIHRGKRSIESWFYLLMFFLRLMRKRRAPPRHQNDKALKNQRFFRLTQWNSIDKIWNSHTMVQKRATVKVINWVRWLSHHCSLWPEKRLDVCVWKESRVGSESSWVKSVLSQHLEVAVHISMVYDEGGFSVCSAIANGVRRQCGYWFEN